MINICKSIDLIYSITNPRKPLKVSVITRKVYNGDVIYGPNDKEKVHFEKEIEFYTLKD